MAGDMTSTNSFYRDKSWYPDKDYSPAIERYFKSIETIYKIQLADGSWKHIKLTPHQREFHSNDISVLGSNAKHDFVTKSRNTSFTVNTIIRLAQSNYYYRDEIVPLSRLNEAKVKELIAEAKKIIEKMTPVVIKRCKNCGSVIKEKYEMCCEAPNIIKDYFPFNNKIVKYNALSIEFPDRDVVWQGYLGLTKDSAEVIRGIRTTRGAIDESNYMRFFKEIYIAMRDSSRGSVIHDDGSEEVHHQITIGSTMKGHTSYYYFLEKIKKLLKNNKINNIRVLEWPVFDTKKFDFDNPEDIWDLVTIAPWHTKKSIYNKILEDYKAFLEEYMCVVTQDDVALYNTDRIIELSEAERFTYDDLKEHIAINGGEYYGGVDPKGEGGHHWALSIFEKTSEGMVQRTLEIIEDDIDLNEKTNELDLMLKEIPFVKFRVDANGLGYQMGQTLQRNNPRVVELIRGNISAKSGRGKKSVRVPINEFMHTNQLTMINKGFVSYVYDEKQLKHFSGWDRKYRAEEGNEYGHCDSTVANALALLPDDWKTGTDGFVPMLYSGDNNDDSSHDEVVDMIKDFHKQSSIKNRMKFYKKNGGGSSTK